MSWKLPTKEKNPVGSPTPTLDKIDIDVNKETDGPVGADRSFADTQGTGDVPNTKFPPNYTPSKDPTPGGVTVDLGDKISDLTKTNYETKTGLPESTGITGMPISLPISEEELIVTKEDAIPLTSAIPKNDLPFNSILCNDGTLVNNDTNPNTWISLYNSFNNSTNNYLNGVTAQLDQFPTVDPARLYTGKIWTSYVEQNELENSGVKFAFFRDSIDKYKAYQDYFDTSKNFLNAVKEPYNPGFNYDFSYKYKGGKTPLMPNIENYMFTGEPVGSIEGTEVTEDDKGSGTREKIVIRTPARPFTEISLLNNDMNIINSLANSISPNIVQFGAGKPVIQNTKTYYDYVCDYKTPKFIQFEKSDFSSNSKTDLYVESESRYNYYEAQYENYIANEDVTENILPDYNIITMNSKWSPLQQRLVGNFQEFESLVNNSDFDDYYNYSTLEGIIDPLSIVNQSTNLFKKFQGQNYFREWTRGASFIGENFPNLPVFKRSDDLIFPAKSSIVETIEKDPFGENYPMFNRISIKMPNSNVIGSEQKDKFDLRVLTGAKTGELTDKVPMLPFDHAYLTRILKHIEAKNFNDESIAYREYTFVSPGGQFLTPEGPVVVPEGTVGQLVRKEDYWKDYVSDKWWLAKPEKNANNNYNFSVSSLNQDSLQFLEFLANLSRNRFFMYGYNPGLEEDKTYLSLLKSNNKNREEALQPIEADNPRVPIKYLMRGLSTVFQNTRKYSDILSGKLAPAQTIGFRILKFKTDAEGNKVEKPVSTYFISNFNDQEGLKDQVFDFFDTRIKQDEKYIYDINALHFIVGTKYTYQSVSKPSLRVMPKKVLPTDVASKFYEMELIVDSFPHVKIVEVPYEENIVLRATNKPPLAPEVEPVPYKNVDNKLLWLIRPQLGKAEQVPVLLLDSDKENLRKQYESQYGGVVEGLGLVTPPPNFKGDDIAKKVKKAAGFGEIGVDPLEYYGDDLTKTYQVFRLSNAPKDYTDFRNAELITQVTSDYSTSTSFKDSLKPNQKYYYIFRSIDIHGNLSNPTPVYEVELINDTGTVYIETKIYDFPTPEKVISKPMKRYLSIEPSFSQRVLNEEESGITQEFTLGKSQQIKLGVENESLFGGNKRIKVRLTSKQTNRKIDFNVDFSIKNTTTEESKNPDKYRPPSSVNIPNVEKSPYVAGTIQVGQTVDQSVEDECN